MQENQLIKTWCSSTLYSWMLGMRVRKHKATNTKGREWLDMVVGVVCDVNYNSV